MGYWARILLITLDTLYGRRRTLSKFKVLELVARVPYQSWEQVAYIAITQMHGRTDFARRSYDRVAESRAQQDNEQWHLLILEELIGRSGVVALAGASATGASAPTPNRLRSIVPS